MPVARRSVEIRVPPARLMDVICDFGAYTRFVPDMIESTVLRSGEGEWTVKFALSFIRRVEYTLLLRREGDLRLTWSLVEGHFKANSGSWELEPLDGGVATRATYTLDLDLGMFVPGSVLKTLVEHNLPAMLEAFRVRAEAA